jgi:hypothetical protein
VSGHAAADPAITEIKSRRRITFPKLGTTPSLAFNSVHQKQEFATSDGAQMANLHLQRS